MQFSDEGYIIKTRRHGESGLILTVLTRSNGKISGYVKNAFSAKKNGIYQLGNCVSLNAYVRLEENLYSFHVDLLRAEAINFMNDEARLSALSSLCELCNTCLPAGLFLVYAKTLADILDINIRFRQQFPDAKKLAKYAHLHFFGCLVGKRYGKNILETKRIVYQQFDIFHS